MKKLPMLQRVSRAMYSTEITQDFLKDLLNRAKQAATVSNKTPNRGNKKNNNYNNNYNRSNRSRSPRNYANSGDNTYNKRSIGYQQSDKDTRTYYDKTKKHISFHPMTSNVSTEALKTNIPKQRQFERTGKAFNGIDEDLIDVLEEEQGAVKEGVNTGASSSPSFTRMRRRTRTTKRDMPNGFIYSKPFTPQGTTTSTVTSGGISLLKTPQEYQLAPVNRLDLLKYHPSLNVNARTRWVDFILRSMNDANFPLYREPNISYAKLIKDQISGPLKPNDVFSVKTPGFGKYIYDNDYSVHLEREPQVENIDVTLNKTKFDEIVLGKYDSPVVMETGTNLNENDRRVDISLQHCSGLSTKDRIWLKQACTGSIPLNQLS